MIKTEYRRQNRQMHYLAVAAEQEPVEALAVADHTVLLELVAAPVEVGRKRVVAVEPVVEALAVAAHMVLLERVAVAPAPLVLPQAEPVHCSHPCYPLGYYDYLTWSFR